MEFIYVWALMALAFGYIAINVWLFIDGLFNRVDLGRAHKTKVQKVKSQAPSGLSPVGS